MERLPQPGEMPRKRRGRSCVRCGRLEETDQGSMFQISFRGRRTTNRSQQRAQLSGILCEQCSVDVYNHVEEDVFHHAKGNE